MKQMIGFCLFFVAATLLAGILVGCSSESEPNTEIAYQQEQLNSHLVDLGTPNEIAIENRYFRVLMDGKAMHHFNIGRNYSEMKVMGEYSFYEVSPGGGEFTIQTQRIFGDEFVTAEQAEKKSMLGVELYNDASTSMTDTSLSEPEYLAAILPYIDGDLVSISNQKSFSEVFSETDKSLYGELISDLEYKSANLYEFRYRFPENNSGSNRVYILRGYFYEMAQPDGYYIDFEFPILFVQYSR